MLPPVSGSARHQIERAGGQGDVYLTCLMLKSHDRPGIEVQTAGKVTIQYGGVAVGSDGCVWQHVNELNMLVEWTGF